MCMLSNHLSEAEAIQHVLYKKCMGGTKNNLLKSPTSIKLKNLQYSIVEAQNINDQNIRQYY